MTPTEEQQPSSTQFRDDEKENNELIQMPNMPSADLKTDEEIEVSAEDNPDRIDNADDLHEIQAGDDLNEPDVDEYQPEIVEEGGQLPSDESEDDNMNENEDNQADQ